MFWIKASDQIWQLWLAFGKYLSACCYGTARSGKEMGEKITGLESGIVNIQQEYDPGYVKLHDATLKVLILFQHER